MTGLARVFPFGFGRQIAAQPMCVSQRVVQCDERHGQIALAIDVARGALPDAATTRRRPTTTTPDRACSFPRAWARERPPRRPAFQLRFVARGRDEGRELRDRHVMLMIQKPATHLRLAAASRALVRIAMRAAEYERAAVQMHHAGLQIISQRAGSPL